MKKSIKLIIAAAVSAIMLFAMSTIAMAAENYSYELPYGDGVPSGLTITSPVDLANPVLPPKDKDTYLDLQFLVSADADAKPISQVTLTNTTQDELVQSWTSIESGVLDINRIREYGWYQLKFEFTNGTWVGVNFNVVPKAPKGVKIYSTYNAIVFDTSSLSSVCGHGQLFGVKMPNGKKYTADIGGQSKVTVNSGKSYKIKMYTYGKYDDSYYPSLDTITKTVKTGPSTKPVIQSIKISNVKDTVVGREWNNIAGEWQDVHRVTWKATVKLSKKAKGIKGIVLSDGVDGQYVLKGDKSTYTVAMSRQTLGDSYKGKKMKFTVTTYSDSTYKAYSPTSKVKTVTIK